jgi:hypothetical protein
MYNINCSIDYIEIRYERHTNIFWIIPIVIQISILFKFVLKQYLYTYLSDFKRPKNIVVKVRKLNTCFLNTSSSLLYGMSKYAAKCHIDSENNS